MFNLNRFPSGFESWHRTHYHVVSYIIGYLRSKDSDGILNKIAENGGLHSIYEIAVEWTTEYEKQNKYREMSETDRMITVRNYCEIQNIPDIPNQHS